MGTSLHEVAAATADHGHTLLTATPRAPEHLLLTMRSPEGSTVAGQWFDDPARAASVHRKTRRGAPDGGVRLLGDSGVVVQPAGADRTLRVLPRLAGTPGATLAAHRPERRGVVRQVRPDGTVTYVKVVRPNRLARTAAGARLAVPGVDTARVLSVDEHHSAVTFAELPGRTLFALLGDPRVTERGIRAAGRAVGRAIAGLHAAPVPAALPTHDAAAELAVTTRWADFAASYGLVPDLPVGELLADAAALLSGPAGAPVLLHRDLHDKQLLLDGDRVGLLDFDLAAAGEPALDLANLLVHLDLRARQGRCTPQHAAACAAGLLDGYRIAPDRWRHRVAAYQLTTRIRLACVYAFRPGHAAAGAALLSGTHPTRRTHPHQRVQPSQEALS